MARKLQSKVRGGCCSEGSGCRIESLVTIDERGQMVLPKALRDRAGIKPGDKMALVAWEQNGKVCCIALVRADELAGLARQMLGPLMS